MPKTHVIERALKACFEKLKRTEFEYSFKKAAGDAEILSMAEDGLYDYLKMLS